MRITTKYGIQGSVPFLDAHVERDNKLFLDPFAVRHAAEPRAHAAAAQSALDSFFAEVVHCSLSDVPGERARGEALLKRFKEPKETRLGLSRAGFAGHGAADDLGERIWRQLTTSLAALVGVGLLRRVEQLPLFVEGVGMDVTSDLTTRIIYCALLDFTGEMMAAYPQLGTRTKDVSVTVWDVSSLDWVEVKRTLPAPDGKPLVLVPAGWVSASLEFEGRRFYEKAILDFAQEETATYNRKGKLVKIAKPKLKLDPRYSRATQNRIHLVLYALDRDKDLLSRFEAWVTAKYDGPDHERNARRLA